MIMLKDDEPPHPGREGGAEALGASSALIRLKSAA